MDELFSAAELADITGGTLLGDATQSCTHVCIDSREATDGSLFVPLPGRHTDGHEFIEDAMRRGASVALVARDYAGFKELLKQCDAHPGALCLVSSPLRAMQQLARAHLSRFPSLLRIGITGSNGKTTTKEMTAAILARHGSTFFTQGNYNSDIGLPLAAFGVDHNHRLAVFEMAMNRRGEIAELADIVRPQIAVITNIGTAHSGLVGSQDQIAYEKKQVFREFLDSHRAVLYEEEPYRGFLAQGVRGHVVYYGPENTPGLESASDLGIDGYRIVLEGEEIHVRLPGRFNLLNALAAIRIAQLVGCSVREIKDGLESMEPAFGRGQILRGAVTVLQDAYNANPESMRSAIRFMSDLTWTGRKIIVLGAMKELGSEGEEQHVDIASLAAAMEPHRLFLFGEEFREAGEALERSGSGDQVMWTRDFTKLAEELTETARSGDVVLLKGSRSMELERLVPYLQEGEG